MGRLSDLKTTIKLRWRNRKPWSEEKKIDRAFLGGIVMMAAGYGWIYRPLFLIVLGTVVAWISWRLGQASTTAAKPPARDEDEDA